MKIPRIYLDTSVINFLFADDSPEKKETTIDFFENYILTGAYDTYISSFVIEEIENTPTREMREKLIGVISDYPINFLDLIDPQEIQLLAKVYVEKQIIPFKKYFDAYHIACSVIHRIDYLVSWNFRHLANVNKERKIVAANLEIGYLNEFRIITPLELMDYES